MKFKNIVVLAKSTMIIYVQFYPNFVNIHNFYDININYYFSISLLFDNIYLPLEYDIIKLYL